MDIDVFTSRQLETVLPVLRTALNPTGQLDTRELRFLDTYARITGFPWRAAEIEMMDLEHVRLDGPHQKKRLVQLAALAVMLSHPMRPESIAYLKALAQRLGTHDTVIDAIEAAAAGRNVKARIITMRRGFRCLFKEAYLAEGWRGILRFVGALFLKAPVNRDRLWQFKRLGLLPEGTLGREYFKHMVSLGFGFPGEPGGIPVTVSYHDVAHVMTGNDSSPLGEIQQGSFQGGNRREDGFFFIQFVVLHFHHGVKIAPDAAPQYGNFHPEKVLWAIHRGAKCGVDMTHQWNYWPLMELPLEAARARVALLPKLKHATELRRAA